MRFLTFNFNGEEGIGVLDPSGEVRGLLASDQGFPGNLDRLVGTSDAALHGAGALLLKGKAFDQQKITMLPPLSASNKIICIGLNYAAHTQEGGFQPQTYPAVFTRFNSSLIGHRAPLLRRPPLLRRRTRAPQHAGRAVATRSPAGRSADATKSSG